MGFFRGRARVVARGGLIPGVVLLLAGCGEGLLRPGDEGLRIVVAEGDAQLADPGGRLPGDLVVQVLGADGEPREGRRVIWEITRGSGAILSTDEDVTNSLGRARTSLTLGPEPARYEVRAGIRGSGADPALLWARAVLRPELTGAAPDPVSPGEIVTLRGGNFISELRRVVVLFSGIRGRVVAGTESTLEATVPPCLIDGSVDVEVVLGSLRSAALPLSVEGEGPVLQLDEGEAVVIRDPSAVSCVRLPEGPLHRYLALVHSGSPEGVSSYPYELLLRGRGGGALRAAPPAPRVRAPVPSGIDEFRSRPGETWIRALEKRATGSRSPLPTARAPAPPRPRSRAPAPGEVRSFSVLSPSGGFDTVTAEVRRVGEHSVIYVDQKAPDGGFAAGDVAEVGEIFDDAIHPTVTGVFGDASDIDENGLVIVLFTPVVNRHSQRGAEGFVGGFFFGVDLLPDREGSNAGEIFYALVPDPDGLFGDPRTLDDVLRNVPAILAHELQHMVHFNQRILEGGGQSTDALWLSEALATTAEDLVADALLERGDSERAWQFRSGNYVRALRFLADPPGVSLVVTQGEGSLEERGAGWLFLKHVRGRTGGNGILTELTGSARTGVRNVAAATGRPWVELVESWAGAVYVDELAVPVEERFLFREFDLRSELSRIDGTYPLEPLVLGGTDRTVVGRVRASTAAHYLLEPTRSGGLSVSLGGPGGGAHPDGSFLAITLLRLR